VTGKQGVDRAPIDRAFHLAFSAIHEWKPASKVSERVDFSRRFLGSGPAWAKRPAN
jgi:hypothetical protein